MASSDIGTPMTRQQSVRVRDDTATLPDYGLEGDIYGFAIKSLVRDNYHVERGNKVCLRRTRMASALLLLWLNVGIQMFLVVQTKKFITAKAVNAIRDTYGQFERSMYGHGEDHYIETFTGHRRGRPEFFQPEAFSNLDEDLKEESCKIPLSQPLFLFTMLLVWSLVCFGEIRAICELGQALIWDLPSGKSSQPDRQVQLNQGDDEEIIVMALRLRLKTIIAVFVMLPRLLVAIVMLWLGCRWLVATNDFENLVLNAVALEFILNTKNLLFTTLVSARSKWEVNGTKIHIEAKTQDAGYFHFLRTFLWGVAAALWVVLYMLLFQSVLPDYGWDVKDVCDGWVSRNFPSNPFAI